MCNFKIRSTYESIDYFCVVIRSCSLIYCIEHVNQIRSIPSITGLRFPKIIILFVDLCEELIIDFKR